MSDESRRSAIRKVMRLKNLPRSQAAAYVDEQLLAIQRTLDRTPDPRFRSPSAGEIALNEFIAEKLKVN